MSISLSQGLATAQSDLESRCSFFGGLGVCISLIQLYLVVFKVYVKPLDLITKGEKIPKTALM